MFVLIVTDDDGERRRCTSGLGLYEGLESTEVATADSAHALVNDPDEPFDALVIDGDLAPEGGYSLLYEIRAAAELAGKSAPPGIILIDRPDDRWLADWAGAAAVLQKPVDSFELSAVLRRIGEESASDSDLIEV